jgi:HTH-type transcriptional regulator / antitoxin HigA
MLKPIKNKAQYEEAIARIYQLNQENVQADSKESDELEVLSILVKEYVSENYHVPKPSPLEAIKFRLEQMGMSEAQLSHLLGFGLRKSHILSGKRKLSLTMIRKLTEVLRIPADVLIQAY